jgi:hypothetical protein
MIRRLTLIFALIFAIGCSASIQGELVDAFDGVGENGLRIFISSQTFSPDVGKSRNDMDSLCATLAAAAGLRRTYIAIASQTGSAPNTRLTSSGTVYQFDSSGNRIEVAAAAADLWSGNALSNNPQYDEKGVFVTATNLWTGASALGGISGNCTDWTDNSGTGITGQNLGGVAGSHWLNRNSLTCGTARRVYCIRGD